jgi:hypothetical protein
MQEHVQTHLSVIFAQRIVWSLNARGTITQR